MHVQQPFIRVYQVSQYQKGKTDLDFTEARDSEWQWHQLSHMQVCTSLQTDNHASTPPLSFYRPDALPDAQPTVSKHWRQSNNQLTHNDIRLCIASYKLRDVIQRGGRPTDKLSVHFIVFISAGEWHSATDDSADDIHQPRQPTWQPAFIAS